MLSEQEMIITVKYCNSNHCTDAVNNNSLRATACLFSTSKLWYKARTVFLWFSPCVQINHAIGRKVFFCFKWHYFICFKEELEKQNLFVQNICDIFLPFQLSLRLQGHDWVNSSSPFPKEKKYHPVMNNNYCHYRLTKIPSEHSHFMYHNVTRMIDSFC